MKSDDAKLTLAAAVVRQIERLGGELVSREQPTEAVMVRTVLGPRPLPEPLRQFLKDVRWPQARNYRARNDDYPHGVRFNWGEIVEDYSCCGDRPYLSIAEDASQFLYFVPLNSSDLTNPSVYRIDHEGLDERLPRPQRLSAFLAGLEPEV
jgi:hypothetical protein